MRNTHSKRLGKQHRRFLLLLKFEQMVSALVSNKLQKEMTMKLETVFFFKLGLHSILLVIYSPHLIIACPLKIFNL